MIGVIVPAVVGIAFFVVSGTVKKPQKRWLRLFNSGCIGFAAYEIFNAIIISHPATGTLTPENPPTNFQEGGSVTPVEAYLKLQLGTTVGVDGQIYIHAENSGEKIVTSFNLSCDIYWKNKQKAANFVVHVDDDLGYSKFRGIPPHGEWFWKHDWTDYAPAFEHRTAEIDGGLSTCSPINVIAEETNSKHVPLSVTTTCKESEGSDGYHLPLTCQAYIENYGTKEYSGDLSFSCIILSKGTHIQSYSDRPPSTSYDEEYDKVKDVKLIIPFQLGGNVTIPAGKSLSAPLDNKEWKMGYTPVQLSSDSVDENHESAKCWMQ